MKSGKKGLRGSTIKATKRRGNRIHVTPGDGGWVVKNEGSTSASGVYRTKDAAERAARESLRQGTSGEIRIHSRDGRIRDSFVVSRSDFARISAVEGLHLSDEMKRDFDRFDRKGQSDAQRRKKISQKYTKPRV